MCCLQEEHCTVTLCATLLNITAKRIREFENAVIFLRKWSVRQHINKNKNFLPSCTENTVEAKVAGVDFVAVVCYYPSSLDDSHRPSLCV
jgi:hypothetical protein